MRSRCGSSARWPRTSLTTWRLVMHAKQAAYQSSAPLSATSGYGYCRSRAAASFKRPINAMRRSISAAAMGDCSPWSR